MLGDGVFRRPDKEEQRNEDRVQQDGDGHDEQQERGAAARVQAAEPDGGLGRHRVPGFVGVDRLVLGPVVAEHPSDVREHGDAHDVADEEQKFEQPVPDVERNPVDVAAEAEPVHGDGQQVRHHDEQAHGEQERHRERDGELPALDFLSGAFGGAFGGQVQGLDPVDEGFDERGETAQEGLFEPCAAGEAEPGASFDADGAVRRADGQRIDVAVTHHDAFHDGLPADERRGGKQGETPQAHQETFPGTGGKNGSGGRTTGARGHGKTSECHSLNVCPRRVSRRVDLRISGKDGKKG